ncbi:3',5'-cyclic-AMP phosphodiesterase [Endozoicomonas sp. Mp262]|uniref:3',5'-cyclic-AMP phosphodiesterase n=1 Tax=Endozoicomonas sp. Mp262 TaxID=2919499 RepID=UPI0021DABE6A
MKRCARVIQISDTHLFADPDRLLYGANPYKNLQAVLNAIQKNNPEVDAIVVSGDLTQDETLASYQWLKSSLSLLEIPFYWLCGNHDDQAVMMQCCPQAMVKRVEVNGWQLLLLDSQIPGEIPGELGDDELAWLAEQLEQYPKTNTLIAVHHHPCPAGSAWLDQINLQNGKQLEDLISLHGGVRAVVHGHIHQASKKWLGNTPCYSVPSSCAQFRPESHEFAIDDSRLPGYRVLDLFDDGSLETHVFRVDSAENPPVDSNG